MQKGAKMARSTRQSKILELISMREIETQDELVSSLKKANFDVTQATISRDIKELGLIKILSSETGKYKYSLVDNDSQAVSNKYIAIFKEAVISIKVLGQFCLIKTIKGMASAICGLLDKLNLDGVAGVLSGDDTVMLVLPNSSYAENACKTLEKLSV